MISVPLTYFKISFNKDIIKVDKITNKLGTVVFSSDIEITEAYAYAQEKTKSEFLVDEAALSLRCTVLNILNTSESLQYPLNASDIAKGEGHVPHILIRFFTLLYTGKPQISAATERARRLIESVSEDVVYGVTRGKVKPPKYCLLGMGIKSMTGSKKVVNILNHFGHSIGYHVSEELETDLAISISDRDLTRPDEILPLEGLATGLAFDNYDENCETLSGSGTLHDTVGITYQNVSDSESHSININQSDEQTGCQQDPASFEVAKRSGKMRSFDAPQYDVQPYRKKPRISTFEYSIKTPAKPSNLKQVQHRDVIWVILSIMKTSLPMWAAWNSLITKDSLPRQTIGYLQNISLPPTRLDVVAETMRVAQRVASECNEKYAVVTYDLAIAKPASQIQVTESPLFDNVFIMFGAFHIMMCFFSCIGYYIDGSGGETILLDSEVLAAGSLNGFLSGKHYNRCKRIHVLLAAAFQKLHFQYFLEMNGTLPVSVKAKLEDLFQNPTPQKIEEIERCEDVIAVLEKYDKFTEKTRNGEHGTTAVYWMTYVDIVGIYKLFSRACRTNDVDLFIFALSLMSPIFFSVNKQNYARWSVRYLLNLLNMDESHPGIRQVLENGALSVRRSSNSFARNPVDMTLEQTINADAASRLTGISAFQQSIAAKNRWTITRSARTAVVTELLEKAGIHRTEEELHKELRDSRVERDNKDISTLLDSIVSCGNPFKEDTYQPDKLYNIATGVATSESVKQELISFRKTGQVLQKEFRDGCFQNPARFEKSIRRRTLKNFANESVKMRVTSKDLKVVELKATRDLFGRLLYLATDKKLDIRMVLGYPLIPVPLCMAHIDGTKHSTTKSKLAKELASKVTSEPPGQFDTYIVDAMYMIRALDTKDLPTTYGGIAKLILTKICTTQSIHFVCDTYRTPSIKGAEQQKRGMSELNIAITGPSQKRPRDFKAALHSTKFKSALLSFLARDWRRDDYSQQLEGRTLYVSCGTECYVYTATDGKVTSDIIPTMENSHEEADSRIVLHLKHVNDINPQSTVVIRCNDTDILCILLHHMKRFSVTVFMDTGLNSDNTRKYIDVTTLGKTIGGPMCEVLPAVHAFSGCDYTCSFMRKGKVKFYTKVESSGYYQQLFAKLGESQEVSEGILDGMEKFMCEMYNKAKVSNLGEARYAIFSEKYAPKRGSDPLAKIKGADASTLPPSRPVLAQKLNRTNFVTMIWRNAHLQDPISDSINPTQSGWKLTDGKYQMVWFVGDQMPKDIAEHITANQPSDNTDQDEYESSFDSDDSDYEIEDDI